MSDENQDPGTDPTPPGGSDPEGKPQYVPDKFWDPDVGIRVEEAFKAYNELEGRMRTKTEDLRAEIEKERLGQVPEAYKFAMPEDVKIPDGIEIDLSENDPLLQWFNGFAKTVGLSQESYNEAIKSYVELELAGMPNIEDEVRKLGENGHDRIQKVNAQLDEKLAPDEKALIAELLTTAAGVSALEKLFGATGPENFEGDPGSAPLTLNELKKLQEDPRYWRDKDPDIMKKVEAGYARLYAGR